MIFQDRTEAGKKLGQTLRIQKIDRPILVALPRGGLPVAAAASEVTGWPLAVFVSRKLRCPWQPELAFGAVTENGPPYFNAPLMKRLGLDAETRNNEVAIQRLECARRRELFKDCLTPAGDLGFTPIIVDDGIATGATMIAAVQAMKAAGFKRVLCAAPVSSLEGGGEIDASCDGLVTLDRPPVFISVGQFYVHFPQLSDDEAVAICKKSNRCFKPDSQ